MSKLMVTFTYDLDKNTRCKDFSVCDESNKDSSIAELERVNPGFKLESVKPYVDPVFKRAE